MEEGWMDGWMLNEAAIYWNGLKIQKQAMVDRLHYMYEERRLIDLELNDLNTEEHTNNGGCTAYQKKIQRIIKMLMGKKLTSLSKVNLNKFYLWKQEIIGTAVLMIAVHGDQPLQVYTTWIWGGIQPELKALCLNLDPVQYLRASMEEYLNQLESTLKPSGFEGLARHIF